MLCNYYHSGTPDTRTGSVNLPFNARSNKLILLENERNKPSTDDPDPSQNNQTNEKLQNIGFGFKVILDSP